MAADISLSRHRKRYRIFPETSSSHTRGSGASSQEARLNVTGARDGDSAMMSFNRSFHKLKRRPGRRREEAFRRKLASDSFPARPLILPLLIIILSIIVFGRANANKNHWSRKLQVGSDDGPGQSRKALHQDDYSAWPLVGARATARGRSNASVIYVKVGALLEESDHEQANMFIRTIKMINERRDETIRQLLNLTAPINSYEGAGEPTSGAAPSVEVRLEPMVEFLSNRDSSLEADGKVCQLIESGCNAIVGPTDGASIQHVQSICDNIEIPYFELRPFLGSAPQIVTTSHQLHQRQQQQQDLRHQQPELLQEPGNLVTPVDSENDKQEALEINRKDPPSNNKLEDLTLNLYPPAYLLTSAYIDLIYAWNWSSFAIVYEDGSSMVKLQDLFRESSGSWTSKWQIKLFQFRQHEPAQRSNSPPRMPPSNFEPEQANLSTLQNINKSAPGSHSLSSLPSAPEKPTPRASLTPLAADDHQVPGPSSEESSGLKMNRKSKASFRDIFWQIKSTGETNIILDIKTERLSEALKNAQQVGCMTERYSYLVTSLDLHTIDLEDFKYSRTRLTAFTILQAGRRLQQQSVNFNERYLEKLGVQVMKQADRARASSATSAAGHGEHSTGSGIKWPAGSKYRLSPSVVLDKAGSYMDPPNEVYSRDWSRREQLMSSPASMGLLPSLDRDNEQRLFEFFVNQQERDNLSARSRLSTASAVLHDALALYMLGLNELDPTGSFLRSYMNSPPEATTSEKDNIQDSDSQQKQFLSCAINSTPWLHGSSLVNYMRRISFWGLTGQVSFDQLGLRSDFKLDMLGMAPELGLVKVGEWHSRRHHADAHQTTSGSSDEPPDPYRLTDGEKRSYDELSAIYEAELRGFEQRLAKGQQVEVPYNRLLASTATRGPTSGPRAWAQTAPSGLLVNEIIFERLYKEQTDQVDTLIVTTKLSQPYFMLKETPNKLEGNDQYEGFVVDLIHELSKLVNFKYRWREAADKKYGSKTVGPNGTIVWNGMIGEIVRGQADLAIVDLTITAQREEAVDFTLPFMNTGISILFKKPTTKVTTLFSFLSPFSSDVWAYVLAAYCGISAILFFVGHLSPYEWADPNPCRHTSSLSNQQSFSFDRTDDDFQDDQSIRFNLSEPIVANLKNQFSLLNSFWFTIGSLMQQGSDLTPRSMSTRTIAGIWYFFTLIMISSYTANLAAFLTVEKVVYPIENVRDLSQQQEIRYGCVESGSTCTFFSDSQIDTYKKINEGMKRHRTYVRSNDEGQKRVEEGKFAFFMESASIEYIVERNCNLTQIGGLLDSKGYGLATSKKSRLKRPYRTLLSEGILHLQETGLLHTLKNRWWKERRGGGTCTDDGKGGGVTELSLANVGGVFVVLLGGLGLSFLVAIAEFMWRSRRSGNSRDRMCEDMMSDLKFALACKRSTKPVRAVEASQERKLPPISKGVRRQLARQQSSVSINNGNGSSNRIFSATSQQQATSKQVEQLLKRTETITDPALIGARQAVSKYGKDCDPILLHAMLTMLMQQQAGGASSAQPQTVPVGGYGSTGQSWARSGGGGGGGGPEAKGVGPANRRRQNLLLTQQSIELADSVGDTPSNWRRNKTNNANQPE